MGFKVNVNGKTVFETEGLVELVDTVTLSTVKGDAYTLNVANDVSEVDVQVSVRSEADGNEPLDIAEIRARAAKAAKVEKAPKKK